MKTVKYIIFSEISRTQVTAGDICSLESAILFYYFVGTKLPITQTIKRHFWDCNYNVRINPFMINPILEKIREVINE